MTHSKDPLLQLLNSSGFPFQLRVEAEISAVKSHHNWSVLADEHHWSHPHTKVDGYIDLIAGYGIVRLVIECKRSAESSWIFLVPSRVPRKVSRARCLCTEWDTSSPDFFAWHDLRCEPSSEESAFCLWRGQNEKEKPMLERLSDNLLQSVEGLACEEFSLGERGVVSERRIYIPVLVTAASLQMCHFDPADVSIVDGRIPNADLEPVSFIRFRKGLARSLGSKSKARDLREANQEKERTLFVVQARELAGFLAAWHVQPMFGETWPHLAARSEFRV